MSVFEYEFNDRDKELIVSEDIGTFTATDYIRLTIYPTETPNQIVTLPNTNESAIFFSSLNDTPFDITITPFGAGLDESVTKNIGIGGDDNDFQIFKNELNSDIYIKPNEIFNEFELPQGSYKIQIDFLNQAFYDGENFTEDFIIKQISTSRTEVRIKLRDNQFTQNQIDNIINTFGEEYEFTHILNIGTGDHIPILNYAIDSVTNGPDNPSLILKLYEPLPTIIQNLSYVTIEREVLTTQIQDIYYFSDVPEINFTDGLAPQPQESWINPVNNEINFENFNQLSQSLDDVTIDSLISQSQYNYPNLNTNFNEFENHTFFGSAKKKLENFENKVSTIQGYYSQISSSLSSSKEEITMDGDSTVIIQERKNLFDKINEEIQSFTPFERFLYFDAQSDTTASAPGLKNYAKSYPVGPFHDGITLNNHDGFNVVYQRTNDSDALTNAGVTPGSLRWVGVTQDVYRVHEKPFFNYSGSIYLSFLIKGHNTLKGFSSGQGKLAWDQFGMTTAGNQLDVPLPPSVQYRKRLLDQPIISSSYRRLVFESSQSYWIPNEEFSDMADLPTIGNEGKSITSDSITVLSQGVKTGSYQIKDSTGKYPTTVITQSGAPFFGSCMPAGELFRLYFQGDLTGSLDEAPATSSFITDVKVTFNDPRNVLPFDNVYHTSSTEWTNWYNDMLTKAENFDNDNIHSFENNLPLYIKESSDYQDMKDFLNLQGEQYDLIRNHIDSMGTLHDRGYKDTNSPPNNTLPMLLSNMGWQAIQPFSSSLGDYYDGLLSSATSIDDVKTNTWRKTLNNLLYIYKSKGTKNSVRGLLNVYGYPPDVLQFQEFGGTTDFGNNNIGVDNRFKEEIQNIVKPNPIVPLNAPPLEDDPKFDKNLTDFDLAKLSGSVSFVTTPKKLFHYRFNHKQNKVLNLNWWTPKTDKATINTFEFVYKHVKTSNEQTILLSSGSGNETLWDLRLKPSSGGLSSSFEFRLNTSKTGSLAIADNALSMSLPYVKMTDGQLWNVMIQRMSSSVSGSGINEYRLHSALQDKSKIKPYTYVTMSVSGGLVGSTTVGGKGFFANQNWVSTGSRHILSSSNLFVGQSVSGSFAEIKAYSTALSFSRFRQHVLNKFSTVGNSINSHKNELIYHFKLNENYGLQSDIVSGSGAIHPISSSTQDMVIVDSSPTDVYSDFSFTKKAHVFLSSSAVYGVEIIDANQLGLEDNRLTKNDKTILKNPKQKVIRDLNPNKPSVLNIDRESSKPLFRTSNRLELFNSPTDFVDNFILNTMDGFNFESYYGKPDYYYSSSYLEFDTLRKEFFTSHPIQVNVNKFIRAHENIFNHSINEGLKTLLPARSSFSDVNTNAGVEIRQTLLEKQKYENELSSVEVNPNLVTGSINPVVDKPTSEQILPKSASIILNYNETGSLILPKSASVSTLPINDYSIVLPKSASFSTLPLNEYSIVLPKSASIITLPSNTLSVESPKSSSINVKPNHSSSIILPSSMSVSILPLTNDSQLETPTSGSNNFLSTHYNKSFDNIHDSWGTGDNDTHFINFASETGSDNNYNVGHIDTRFNFISIGDTEIYSGSHHNSGSFNFTDFSNQGNFYNRAMITRDFHSNVSYASYMNGNPGLQTGRMLGKTRYFFTSSEGEIILPVNHITKFSQPFKELMINGTQNIDPGLLNVQYEDYSTSSFYRVKVTGGENQIRITGNTSPDVSGDGTITYG